MSSARATNGAADAADAPAGGDEQQQEDNTNGAMFSQSLDRLKESFLFAAAQGGNALDVQSLLEIGADIDWKGQGGDTPLLAACRRGHCETMAILAVHGSNVDAIGGDGMSCLHIAARRGDIASLNVMLEADANLALKDKDGKTALDVAKAKGHEDICQRLVQFRRTGQASGGRGGGGGGSGSGGGPRTNFGTPSIANALPTPNAGFRSPRRNLPALNGAPSSSTTSTVINDISGPSSSNGPRPASSSSSSSSSSRPTSSVPTERASTRDRDQDRDRGWSKADDSKENHRSEDNSNASGPTSALSHAQPKTFPEGTTASSKDVSSPLSRPVVPPTQTYALIGQAYQDATATALTKLLETETRERSRADAKVAALSEQNARLTAEVTASLTEAQGLLRERDALQRELDLLKGRRSALEGPSVTLEVCAELERVLKISLDNIEARKSALVVEALEQQKEQRLCVICQEKDKSVVLLPCRHLCLCEVCSQHDDLSHCPLCRRPIAHRISVFS